MVERRTEPRIDVNVKAEMTPLAAVATRLGGHVMNVSAHGVRIHVAGKISGQPRNGDVYRILSGRDLILGEVRHWCQEGPGADIGFKILHWGDIGELNRIAQAS